MTGQVLHLMELHFFMKGVVGSWCFCLFQFGLNKEVTLVSWASVCDKGTFRKGSVFAAYFQLIHSFTHTIYNFTRACTRVKKSLIEASLRASSPIWASEASRERTRERAAKARGTEERRNLLSPPPLPAFVSPLACLSRVYFSRYLPN